MPFSWKPRLLIFASLFLLTPLLLSFFQPKIQPKCTKSYCNLSPTPPLSLFSSPRHHQLHYPPPLQHTRVHSLCFLFSLFSPNLSTKALQGMTDYRLPSNLWTDDNSSAMEAFMSSDLSSFWPTPSQPQSSASTTTPGPDPTKALTQTQPPVTLFSQETLQQRLQALIEGARESWTYAIFWQSSFDYSGASVLGWGDAYYKGEDDKSKAKVKTMSSDAEQNHRKKVLRELNYLISGSSSTTDDTVDEEVTDTEWFFLVSMTQSFMNGVGLPGQAFFNSSSVWVTGEDRLAASTCERARQGQVFGLQTLVCIPSANGVVELGSTELIFQNSDLMNKVRVLFNFDNLEVGSWPLTSSADQGENDPSSLWLNDPSEIRDSVSSVVPTSVPSSSNTNSSETIEKPMQSETSGSTSTFVYLRF